MSAQIKIQEKGGRQCCAYGLGADTAHPALHCGFEYFQQSAKERKVVRLSSFRQWLLSIAVSAGGI